MRMSASAIRATPTSSVSWICISIDLASAMISPVDRLHQTLNRDLGRLHLVPAHIEEFVKAGVKRARLARRVPEFSDFEPGIEATKSIATTKPAA